VRRCPPRSIEAGLQPQDVDVGHVDDRHRSCGPVARGPYRDAPGDLRPDVRRVPMFGLGCVAGAAGGRPAQRLSARVRPMDGRGCCCPWSCAPLTFPRDRVRRWLLSSALRCSATAPRRVCRGRRASVPRRSAAADRKSSVRGAICTPTRRTQWAWKHRFHRVRAHPCPGCVQRCRGGYLADDVTGLLAAYGLGHLGCPVRGLAIRGGPKVIEAIVSSLGLPDDRTRADVALLERGRQPLVVFGAARLPRQRSPSSHQAASPGIMLAMGPWLLLRTRHAALAVRRP